MGLSISALGALGSGIADDGDGDDGDGGEAMKDVSAGESSGRCWAILRTQDSARLLLASGQDVCGRSACYRRIWDVAHHIHSARLNISTHALLRQPWSCMLFLARNSFGPVSTLNPCCYWQSMDWARLSRRFQPDGEVLWPNLLDARALDSM